MAVELLSVSPSPSREQDVFGNELRLSEGERKQLSSAGDIFLSKTVHIDTHSKKGDGTEPRTLVISSSRCYLIQNPVTKLETSFNFLQIRQMQCSSDKLTFYLSGEAKPRELLASKQDSVEVMSLITAQLKNVFPKTPLDILLKLTFDPDSLRHDVSSLRDELTAVMDRVDANTIQGFLISYGFLCDFFGVEYSKDVSWYLKNVYLAHGLREIKLSDFDHLSPKDFLPVVSSLRHNYFFEGVVERDNKLGLEVVEELGYALSTSHSIKTLILSNCGFKPESVIKLSNAIKHNPRTSLTHLNLSENILDDKAVESLGSALETLPHGLQQLILANCKMTVKGATQLANSMKLNKHMEFTLVHLDLSSNTLGPDILGALGFIQETQTISTLKLSNCSLLLESVIPVLIRSCTQHLCELDLSNNTGRGKKVVHGPSVASGLQQFCSSSIAIHSLNLSNCRLTSVPVMKILEGLAVNPNVMSVKVDVSSNDLSGNGVRPMLSAVGKVPCLHQLNISDCSLDQNMPDIISAITENRNLQHLMVGRNFGGKNVVRMMAAKQLASFLSREDCQLVSLCLEDSQLKENTNLILEALVDNTNLAKINLSGNQMGNRGASCLARTLLSNCSLTEICWDRNDVQLRGFQEISAALEQNYTLRVMPLPLNDISRARKGVEEYSQVIQTCLCRNHSDERLKVEIAARHRARLLTASQQSSAVGRELVQLEDLLKWLQAHSPSHELIEEASDVSELANRTIKLTDGIYSPKVESEQFRTITNQVRELLNNFMEDLFIEHIKKRSEKMVDKAIEICHSFLSEEIKTRLHNLIVEEKGEEFAQAKKDVLRHALPEIVNHVSDSNVDVAANISELVVEHTLHSLERVNHKLFKLQKERQTKDQQMTDAKVSRNFTFRVQEDSSPKKKKKRVRRPDPDDQDETDQVELPSVPLVTEGPTLQHLGKTRPKPARMQRGRPSKKPSSHSNEPTTSDNPPQATDSSPQMPDSTPPQPKVAMKPPSPQVAQKKIKELIAKSRSSSSIEQEAKKEESEVSHDCPDGTTKDELKETDDGTKDELKETDDGTKDELKETDDETKDELKETDDGKSSNDERSTSEEVEEHRTVVQEVASSDETTDQKNDSPDGESVVVATTNDEGHEPMPTNIDEPAPPSSQGEAEGTESKKKSSEASSEANASSLGDWEVIGDVKKMPPAVKQKPKNKTTESSKKEGKRPPILPPQISMAESPKPESDENVPISPKPSEAREAPSPAPKTRPKPASRKKMEEKPPADEKAVSDLPSVNIES